MKEKKEKFNATILFVILGIIIVVLGYLVFFDTNTEPIEVVNHDVEIEMVNDSTYHINLEDGYACFTMEKINDSLSIDAVNVTMCTFHNDSISMMIKKNFEHCYDFSYKDFFNEPLPYLNKIGVKLN